MRKTTEFNDRKLAGELRTITNKIAFSMLKKYQDNKLETAEEKKLAEDILIKCLGSSLPRINEHSGKDGEPIEIRGVEILVRK